MFVIYVSHVKVELVMCTPVSTPKAKDSGDCGEV